MALLLGNLLLEIKQLIKVSVWLESNIMRRENMRVLLGGGVGRVSSFSFFIL